MKHKTQNRYDGRDFLCKQINFLNRFCWSGSFHPSNNWILFHSLVNFSHKDNKNIVKKPLWSNLNLFALLCRLIGFETHKWKQSLLSIQINLINFHANLPMSSLFIAETIVNEHPVTIYPGPKRVVPPRTLPGSIERHRDVCRKNTSSDLSSSSSSQELKSPIKELMSPTIQSSNGFILKNDDFIKRPKSPKSVTASPTNATPLGLKISIQTMDNLMNNRNIIHNAKMEQKMNLKNSKRNSKLSDDDEDKFSDDSLEDTSLPPSAPPIVVPPPPSLSAPVTPSKRHSIAWEVNLDDLCSTGNVFGSKVRFLHIFITFGRVRSSSCPFESSSRLRARK